MSSNRVQISRFGGGVAEGSAFICGYRNIRDSFSMFIMIYYSQLRSFDVYFWDNEDIELDSYSEAEEEAVVFCENMGFIMNNTHFRMASDEEKRLIILECPFAYRNIDEFAKYIERRASISKEIKRPISEVLNVNKEVQTQAKAKPPKLSQEIFSDAFTRKLARLLSSF
ncbi:MAG: hypothetical protein N2746_07135 [Deltaproteobacteria bacterium]|nr:hypothetical protein [Deltaproteobacteria bacterium]